MRDDGLQALYKDVLINMGREVDRRSVHQPPLTKCNSYIPRLDAGEVQSRTCHWMLVVHLTIPCVCAGHAYAELCSCASHACAAHHATSTQGKGLLTFLCLSLHKHITRVLCLFFLPSQNTNAEGPEPYTIEGYHQPASSEGRRPAAAEYACILAAIPRLVALPFTAVSSHLTSS